MYQINFNGIFQTQLWVDMATLSSRTSLTSTSSFHSKTSLASVWRRLLEKCVCVSAPSWYPTCTTLQISSACNRHFDCWSNAYKYILFMICVRLCWCRDSKESTSVRFFFFNIKNLLENWKSFTVGIDIRQRENILAIAMISRKP